MKYTFIKTTTHYATIEAATQAQAQRLVDNVSTIDDEVESTTDEDWELLEIRK